MATARNANSEDEVSDADLKLGLLAYPVLQAADIALYKSTLVPVGEDQTQHLELSRDICEAFNRQFGDVFPLPDVTIGTLPLTRLIAVPQKRILSLKDPSQKMSKSAPNPASRISITDSAKEITAKIKAAVTDSEAGVSYDPENRPGVANLLTIWSALDDAGRSPAELAKEAENSGFRMGQLKAAVSELVVEKLSPIREEYLRLQADPGYIRDVAARGADKARERAAVTMEEVRRVTGMGPL